MSDLRQKNPNQWYSAVKRMALYDNKAEEIIVDDISHHSNQKRCELIADEFSQVPNSSPHNPRRGAERGDKLVEFVGGGSGINGAYPV